MISSFPIELVWEILLHLEYRDLCSMKLTCRTIYHATKSRQFWQRVVSSLMLTSEREGFHKQMLECSPSELEKWGTCSLRAYDRWALDAPLTLRLRSTFKFSTTSGISQFQVIPGCRWLVASSNEGNVFLYDLHSPCPRPHELFDPGEKDEKDGTMDRLAQFGTWIDPAANCSASGNLHFRFVSWNKNGPEMEGHVTRIQIHEVDVYTNGGEVHSSAKRIFEKRSYQFGLRRTRMTLSQEYLAEIQLTDYREHDSPRWLVVCRYTANPSGAPKDDTSLLVEMNYNSSLRQIFITPQNQVIIIGRHSVDVYAISRSEHCDTQPCILLLHHANISTRYGNITAPFSDQGFNWMVAIVDDEYWVIQLSQENTIPPRTAMLGRHPLDPKTYWVPGCATHDAAITFYKDWTTNIMTYSWDIEMAQCVFRVKQVHLPHFPATKDTVLRNLWGAGVDMLSGQVVILADGGCTVFTTA